MSNQLVNIDSGVRLSFAEIFRSPNLRIEIPIIQRDYAHGRVSAKRVRKTFINALFNYLNEGKPNRDLDFVYGSIKQKDSYSCFVPLDGQQRLTTLFLLHWYLSLSNQERFLDFQSILSITDKERFISKFSYETRTSSKEFCDALISHGLDLNKLIQPDEGKLNTVSNTIRNKGWYFLSWDNDPTVSSMLNMLDSIHYKFLGYGHFYNRLMDKKSPVITFFFLNLKEFKLTDDLYIKMNARGKPLTPFENFKAKFEQSFEQLKWTKKNNRTLCFDEHIKEVNPKEYFSFKIDTSWADLFWNYRGLVVNYNSYDEELMNFIRVIFTLAYAENVSSDKDNALEFLIGTQVAEKHPDYTNDLTFEDYLRFGAINVDSINYLLNSFDVFENGTNKIRIRLQEQHYFDEQEVFNSVLSHSLNQVQRVRFYAYMQYLLHFNNNHEEIDNWMRVVFNLTENTIIDSAADVAKAIQSISKLTPLSNQILEKGRLDDFKIDFFSSRQVEEEKIKIHLIAKGEQWTEAIYTAESHCYFKGQIGFILELSDVYSYYHQHGNCNWTQEENIVFLNSFTDYHLKAKEIFDIIDSENGEGSGSINYHWERAVLCYGDYLLKASQYRKNFLSTSKNMRDYSWKRLLRLPPINAKPESAAYWHNRRGYIKSVFDDELFDRNNIADSLESICKRRMPSNWRKFFVTEPRLIKYCEQGFIRYESELNITLFKQSQQNHYQRELRTYNFYLTELENSQIIIPFEKTWFYEVRSGEEDSCAVLEKLIIDDVSYKLNVYHFEFSPGYEQYKICFFRAIGENINDNYDDGIKGMLTGLGYRWQDDFGYFLIAETEAVLKEEILKINFSLNTVINT